MFVKKSDLCFIFIALVGIGVCFGEIYPNSGGLNETDVKNMFGVFQAISDLEQAHVLWNYAVARKKNITNNNSVTEVSTEFGKQLGFLAGIPNVGSATIIWFRARSILKSREYFDAADVDKVRSLRQIMEAEIAFFRYLYYCASNNALGKWTGLLVPSDWGSNKQYEYIMQQLNDTMGFLMVTELQLRWDRQPAPTFIAAWGEGMWSPGATKLDKLMDVTNTWTTSHNSYEENKACYDAIAANITGIPDIFEVERTYRMTKFLYQGANTSAYQGDAQLGADVSATYVFRCLDSLVGMQREWFRGRYVQANATGTQIGTIQDILRIFMGLNRVADAYIADGRLQGFSGFPADADSLVARKNLLGLEAPLSDYINRAIILGRNNRFILTIPMDTTDMTRLFDLLLLDQSDELHYAKPSLTFNALDKLPQPFYTITGEMGAGQVRPVDPTPAPVTSTSASVAPSPAPGGSTPAQGGSTPAPGGSTPAPGGSTPAPGGSTPAPGGSTPAPGGSTPAPGGSTQAPGGSTLAPGGSTSAPGGSTLAPGGSTSAPGAPSPTPAPETTPSLATVTPTVIPPATTLFAKNNVDPGTNNTSTATPPGLSTGVIGGIIAGAIVLLALLVAAGYCIYSKAPKERGSVAPSGFSSGASTGASSGLSSGASTGASSGLRSGASAGA